MGIKGVGVGMYDDGLCDPSGFMRFLIKALQMKHLYLILLRTRCFRDRCSC